MHLVVLFSNAYLVDTKRAVQYVVELAKQNATITVCIPNKIERSLSAGEKKALEQQQITVLCAPAHFSYSRWVKHTLLALYAQSGFKAVCLVQPGSTRMFWAIRSVLQKTKASFIFACLGSVRTSSRTLLQAFWWQRAFSMFCQIATYAYTDSVAMSLLFQTRGIAEDQIATIPLQSVATESIRVVAAPPVAWDISVVTPLSGAHNLYPLFSIVESIPNCRMLVIGGGPEKDALMTYIKQRSLDGRIQFTGWFPGMNEVISSIKSTRMFVCTAEHLQTQYMLLNVLACSVPVILHPSELTSGIISHEQNGLLVSDNSIDLQEKIVWCLQHPERRKYLAERATHDAERFSSSTLEQRWKEFIQAVTSDLSLYS